MARIKSQDLHLAKIIQAMVSTQIHIHPGRYSKGALLTLPQRVGGFVQTFFREGQARLSEEINEFLLLYDLAERKKRAVRRAAWCARRRTYIRRSS